MIYYVYDDQGYLIDVVKSDVQPANSTTVSPFDRNGIVKAGTRFDISKKAWSNVAGSDNKTNNEQQQLAQLALQQAQFQANQQKLNSQLALQLAQLTAKEAQNV